MPWIDGPSGYDGSHQSLTASVANATATDSCKELSENAPIAAITAAATQAITKLRIAALRVMILGS